ncbi:hypothetical protein BDF21DRAFT_404426 [Thamnidium elegans]|nr:hypothetical protein BDF21DRAFT_404426 [Thamnidium elegans]
MPRIVLYPEQEVLLGEKRLAKYAAIHDEEKQQCKRKRNTDTPEELRQKNKSRQERNRKTAVNLSADITRLRILTEETINQRLKRVFNNSYGHFVVTSIIKPQFIRGVLFKTQIFVNQYILKNCYETTPNEFFTQTFCSETVSLKLYKRGFSELKIYWQHTMNFNTLPYISDASWKYQRICNYIQQLLRGNVLRKTDEISET